MPNAATGEPDMAGAVLQANRNPKNELYERGLDRKAHPAPDQNGILMIFFMMFRTKIYII